MYIQLKNSVGVLKTAKIGFSWTTFLFGFIPALIRGDLKWAAIMFIFAVVTGVFTLGWGTWIPSLIFSFFYNKIYLKELLEKGYVPADDMAKYLLQERGIIAA
ncbi:DUF2628 domain-containing protein [Paenibacillus spiritus]|uniref:DUF2628 domain-containing protein n=1 Tax=Paenibacillus spiritus TaxID=2496557 RepID=A0A5J5FVB9_9BACL|nr:DUF2628 domain-containing protein [Paenibacillus spiritus]KAA8997583.1 DUF2628 domain-containing protein [Paenibacillus spiritus]